MTDWHTISAGLVVGTHKGKRYLLFGMPSAWRYRNEQGLLTKRPAPTPAQFRHYWMRRHKLYAFKRTFGWWLPQGDYDGS